MVDLASLPRSPIAFAPSIPRWKRPLSVLHTPRERLGYYHNCVDFSALSPPLKDRIAEEVCAYFRKPGLSRDERMMLMHVFGAMAPNEQARGALEQSLIHAPPFGEIEQFGLVNLQPHLRHGIRDIDLTIVRRFLASPDERDRSTAVHAIKVVGIKQLVTDLRAAYYQESSTELKCEIVRAAGWLRTGESLRLVKEASRSKDREIRKAARAAMAGLP